MLGVAGSDIHLNIFSDLTKYLSLCLDHIATDLHLWRVDFTKVDYRDLPWPLPLPLIECTARMRVRVPVRHRE